MTTIEQLAGLTSQHNEIIKRVCNGTLDPVVVKRELQRIIEGKSIASVWDDMPTWWRTPEQQRKRARQLWPHAVLPEPPKKFVPRTESEVLLLHVPDTFDNLWRMVMAPKGYTKYDAISGQQLRLTANKREFIEPVWVAFDPEHGKGEDANSFQYRADIAASEVFSALIQFPEWSLAWSSITPAPDLTGYKLRDTGSWTCVPSLLRLDGIRQLTLGWRLGGSKNVRSASPSVREC